MNNMAGQFKFHYLTLSLSLSGEASVEHHTDKRWTSKTEIVSIIQPTNQIIRLQTLNALVCLFCFRIKKSAIWMAIIGANTEPIKYRKSVTSARGKKTAPAVPTMVTATANHLPFIFDDNDSLETPAEYASRKVVVTVENTMINRPAMPRPAFTMICAISDSPVKMAAPMPMTYIQQETTP